MTKLRAPLATLTGLPLLAAYPVMLPHWGPVVASANQTGLKGSEALAVLSSEK